MDSGGRGKTALIAILLVAAFLRFYGISFGLPFLYDPDEGVYVTSAILMLRNHDPNPHWFGAPASTTIYMIAGITATRYTIGKIIGVYRTPHDFRDSYDLDPGVVYLPGRILCTLFGVASVFLVYWILLRIVNLPVALVSAALLAVSPLHIEYSKLIRMDVQLGLILLTAFWCCLNILERQDLKNYLFAGFLVGLACVTKYYGIVFGGVLALSHLLANGFSTKHFQRLIASCSMILAGAFIGSPFVFLDYKQVLRDVKNEAVTRYVGVPTSGFLENIVWFVTKASVDCLGIVGVLFVAAGLVFWVRTNHKVGLLVASFPVSLFLFLSFLGVRWERWIVPSVPFLCMLAGFAIVAIGDYFRRWNAKLAAVVTVVILCITVSPLIRISYIQGREMTGEHTRTQAHNWFLQSVPAGSRVLGEVYTPQLPIDKYDVFYVKSTGELKEANKKVSAHFRIGGNLGKIRNIEEIEKAGIQYFIMSNMYDRYLKERDKFPEIIHNYEALMGRATLLHEIKRQPGKNRGPHLRIYRFDWAQSANEKG